MPKTSAQHRHGKDSDPDDTKSKKGIKKTKGDKNPRGGSRLGHQSLQNDWIGNASSEDTGAAGSEGVSSRKQKNSNAHVKQRGGEKKYPAFSRGESEAQQPSSSPSEETSSESSKEDGRVTQTKMHDDGERGFVALAEWFKQHSKALSLTLPGSAEAGCMNEDSLHPRGRKQVKNRVKKRKPSFAKSPTSDRNGISGTPNAQKAAASGPQSHPKYQPKIPRRPVLLEEDLFGGPRLENAASTSFTKLSSSTVSQNWSLPEKPLAQKQQPSRFSRPVTTGGPNPMDSNKNDKEFVDS